MKIFITGGAGFIGSNAVKYFCNLGYEVIIFDNLSRIGTSKNLEWIQTFSHANFILGDIRDYDLLLRSIEESEADVVLHLAGQVAVTTSVSHPREDFEINALGTLNVCEAVRNSSRPPILIFSSTNKVYGKLDNKKIIEINQRYSFVNDDQYGIDESTPLQFYSPYGCSKGAADQYVIDYARIYGLKSVVFRQSCIYGTRQMGVEDQGWVAWFTIAFALQKKISIYGNGKQVRDLLFVDDLIGAYHAAILKIDRCSGEAFNIGGGVSNTLSLLELMDILRLKFGEPNYVYDVQRPGDQEIFVCDLKKARNLLGWTPKVSVREGVDILADWVRENLRLFKS